MTKKSKKSKRGADAEDVRPVTVEAAEDQVDSSGEERSASGRKLDTKTYEKELKRLQEEICHLQAWVKKTGARIVIIFEGRDAAGKGGVIKRLTERVSPRVFRVVALPSPSDREKSQIFMQRYIAHLPAAGEVVIFDRSWYNRAGVERVMGFCTEEQARRFLEVVPRYESDLVESGLILLKYFLDVSPEEQEKRFHARIDDPLRQWKLSPMDVESYEKWWDYTTAYQDMLRMTDSPHAPWWVVSSDDKKRARLNCIAHILRSIPYERVAFKEPKLGKRQKKPKDFVADETARNYVPDYFGS
jgi:polyphosphate kinase 2